MADKKISDLTALTTPAPEDLLVIVDDPSGSATTKKITVENLFTSPANVYYPNYSATDQGVTGDNNTIKYAVDTIAANSGTIFLRHNSGSATTTYTLSTSETIGATIQLVIENGALISIDTGITLTIYSPANIKAAPNQQIFTGAGTVAFSTWGGGIVWAEWFGAVGDNSTAGATNATAIAAAIASLPTANSIPVLGFAGKRYKIAGDPAINFNIPMIIEGNGSIFDYESGTGTAVVIGSPVGTAIAGTIARNFKVVKTKGVTGTAATDLTGTGILIRNLKNFALENLSSTYFKYGLKFWGEEAGCAYGEVFNPIVSTSLVGVHFDSSNHADSWTTNIKVYGGRVSFDDTTYNTLAKASGSIGAHIDATNTNHVHNGIHFYGSSLENAAERKVKIEGEDCSFNNIYWDLGSKTGNYPYRASLTACSGAAGSAVITKAVHGITAIAGDILVITSATTSADREVYIIQSSDADTITVDRALNGTDADIALTVYRANIELTSASRNNLISGGSNLYGNVISDANFLGAATNWRPNSVIDPLKGLSIGTADPRHGVSIYDIQTAYPGLFTFRGQHGGTLYGYIDNAVNHATAGDVGVQFRAKDARGALRPYASILANKTAYGNGTVTGDLRLNAGITSSGAPPATGIHISNESLNSLQLSRGTLKTWTYQSDSLVDTGAVDLPDATSGFIIISANGEGGMLIIQSDGTTTKASGTAGLAAASTPASICVYDTGTKATILNRLGVTAEVRATYFYN